MSFFDDASLVTIPSGIKDGVVYSVKPIDGSGDLTFSRGSDIEATRVNANGYIEKAQVNLLLQSNSFDTTWISLTTTLTGGQADKDGGTTAWKLEANTAGTASITQTVSVSGVMTASIYAKAGTTDWFRFSLNDSGINTRAWFDLTNGVVGSSFGNIISTDIENVGSGWYRCSIIFNATAANVLLFLADGDGTISPDAGDYIYIQDAQLNYGLVAQDYVETTTASVVSGITNDMPRLNYDPANPTCPSLLLEPSRQNLFAHSEYFGGGNWTSSNATIANNTLTSPEGTQNASTFTTSVAGADLRDAINVTGTYTFSVFAKLGDVGGIRLRIDAATDANAYFDLTDGSLDTIDGTNAVADLEDYGNGWYRCYLTADVVNTQKIQIFTTDGTTSYANGSIYLYGAQLEAGSYPTSYLPTYGSSATRTADSASKTGISSLIGSVGTLFVELKGQQNGGPSRRITLSDGTNNNRVALEYDEIASRIRAYIVGGGLNDGNADADGFNQTQQHKVAVVYNGSALKLFIDGALETTLSTAVTASGMDRIQFNGAIGGNSMYAFVDQLLVFKTALSDAEAITLTTL